eukprot:TRINITY_DN6995_c0_g1_i3.p1 TRINITY_DN6995_c0_g1~~TRINITY_DN6995_c0_g1_i3.p1  ORF type:complete len:1310 (+),score=227.70 TRINITY_DN6995_c0_g1_i3:104-4033(+)
MCIRDRLWRELAMLMRVTATHLTHRHHRMGLLPNHTLSGDARRDLKLVAARELLLEHGVQRMTQLKDFRDSIEIEVTAAGQRVQALQHRCKKTLQQFEVDKAAAAWVQEVPSMSVTPSKPSKSKARRQQKLDRLAALITPDTVEGAEMLFAKQLEADDQDWCLMSDSESEDEEYSATRRHEAAVNGWRRFTGFHRQHWIQESDLGLEEVDLDECLLLDFTQRPGRAVPHAPTLKELNQAEINRKASFQPRGRSVGQVSIVEEGPIMEWDDDLQAWREQPAMTPDPIMERNDDHDDLHSWREQPATTPDPIMQWEDDDCNVEAWRRLWRVSPAVVADGSNVEVPTLRRTNTQGQAAHVDAIATEATPKPAKMAAEHAEMDHTEMDHEIQQNEPKMLPSRHDCRKDPTQELKRMGRQPHAALQINMQPRPDSYGSLSPSQQRAHLHNQYLRGLASVCDPKTLPSKLLFGGAGEWDWTPESPDDQVDELFREREAAKAELTHSSEVGVTSVSTGAVWFPNLSRHRFSDDIGSPWLGRPLILDWSKIGLRETFNLASEQASLEYFRLQPSDVPSPLAVRSPLPVVLTPRTPPQVSQPGSPLVPTPSIMAITVQVKAGPRKRERRRSRSEVSPGSPTLHSPVTSPGLPSTSPGFPSTSPGLPPCDIGRSSILSEEPLTEEQLPRSPAMAASALEFTELMDPDSKPLDDTDPEHDLLFDSNLSQRSKFTSSISQAISRGRASQRESTQRESQAGNFECVTSDAWRDAYVSGSGLMVSQLCRSASARPSRLTHSTHSHTSSRVSRGGSAAVERGHRERLVIDTTVQSRRPHIEEDVAPLESTLDCTTIEAETTLEAAYQATLGSNPTQATVDLSEMDSSTAITPRVLQPADLEDASSDEDVGFAIQEDTTESMEWDALVALRGTNTQGQAAHVDAITNSLSKSYETIRTTTAIDPFASPAPHIQDYSFCSKYVSVPVVGSSIQGALFHERSAGSNRTHSGQKPVKGLVASMINEMSRSQQYELDNSRGADYDPEPASELGMTGLGYQMPDGWVEPEQPSVAVAEEVPRAANSSRSPLLQIHTQSINPPLTDSLHVGTITPPQTEHAAAPALQLERPSIVASSRISVHHNMLANSRANSRAPSAHESRASSRAHSAALSRASSRPPSALAAQEQPILGVKAKLNRDSNPPSCSIVAAQQRRVLAGAKRMKQQLVKQQQNAFQQKRSLAKPQGSSWQLDTASNSPTQRPMSGQATRYGPSTKPQLQRPATAMSPKEKRKSNLAQACFSMCGSQIEEDFDLDELLARKSKFKNNFARET